MSESVLVVCPQCNSTNRLPSDKLSAGGKCGVCHERLFRGEPFALSSMNFQKHISKTQLPLVIDYWASWCGPCKMMAPIFSSVAKQLEPNVLFAKVDTEANQQLAAAASVRSIPTLIIYRHGSEIARTSGVMDDKNLSAWIRQNIL